MDFKTQQQQYLPSPSLSVTYAALSQSGFFSYLHFRLWGQFQWGIKSFLRSSQP